MFPIRDHNPSGRVPYVTYTIIAINILAFLSYVSVIDEPRQFSRILSDFALVPREVMAGHELYTVFTSMFMHAGWMHLAGNLLFLWIFGDNMEEEFGHFGFLIFYLACGVTADVVHVLAAPNSAVPLVGASGAIAGVLGGYLLMFPKAKVDILLIIIIYFRVFSLSAWIVLAVWFGIQVFQGLGSAADGGGVAYWAHAGGFVAGLLFAAPAWLRRGGTAFWDRTEGHPPHPPQDIPTHISRIPVVQRRRR